MTREEQAQYIFEKLMENPEFRKAFVGAITDAVNEVVTVIKALEQEPCTDAISRQAVLEILNNAYFLKLDDGAALQESVNQLPPVKPQYTDAEIQKMQDLEFAEIQKAYEIGKAEGVEVLEEIRAEIDSYCSDNRDRNDGLYIAMRIIDKYKASPTGEEVEE